MEPERQAASRYAPAPNENALGSGMNSPYECPRCHEPVAVGEHQTQVKCDRCRALLAVRRVAGKDGWETELTVIGVSLND